MKINTIYLSGNKISRALNNRNSMMLTVTVLCLAVISSVVLYVFFYQEINTSLNEAFSGNISITKAGSKPVDFSDLLLPYLLFYSIVAISSTSIFGNYILAIFSFLRISGISIILCYLYYNFSLKGLEYAFLIFLPGKFLYILSLLLSIKACRLCVSRIRNKLKDNNTVKKEIIAGFVASFIIMVASVITDYCLFKLFSDLFSF